MFVDCFMIVIKLRIPLFPCIDLRVVFKIEGREGFSSIGKVVNLHNNFFCLKLLLNF